MTRQSRQKRLSGHAANATPLNIDDSLIFRLLRLVNLTAKPFVTHFAGLHDLTINEWRIMIVLANRPDIAAHELCDLVGLDKMSVSRAVRRLVAHQRVTRTTDSLDRRRSLLRLTPAGMKTFMGIAPTASERERDLLVSLDDRERDALARLIDKLSKQAETWSDDSEPQGAPLQKP